VENCCLSGLYEKNCFMNVCPLMSFSYRFPPLVLLIGAAICVAACRTDTAPENKPIAAVSPQRVFWPGAVLQTTALPRATDLASLNSLHVEMDSSNQTRWQACFASSPQTMEAYLSVPPVRPYGERRYLYVGILGELTATQMNIFEFTCEYLSLFWGVDVRYFGKLATEAIPPYARRFHGNKLQFRTDYVLEQLMRKQLPDDAVNFLLLTATDLYPGDDWNFVFGQASTKNRVGVWSLARYGDPDESPEAYQLCLIRSLKTASHEVGHLFSLDHCTFFACVMQGAIDQEESDQKPVFLCPVCLEKGQYACEYDLADRFNALAAFWRKAGCTDRSAEYSRFFQRITEGAPSPSIIQNSPARHFSPQNLSRPHESGQ
jgi:archaemetzincin